ncbi:hypothetical protein BTM25_35580 [Actinomadura rubteroloni]|uniref:Peptidase C51 domain-containing protein n=1 Tax=Actinomadura rubteroloni TaxID=1926885 RepID=A0A2P4UIN4_9ACTN|nr:CHAP domain-containing protein [Actinomadura rubteroloni]POM24919.1 hypothetical protein BTM25_35580 [Actinomadura rubteroloni]
MTDHIGEKLLKVAKKELGYHEKSGGYTKYGDWYRSNVGGGDDYFSTAPWCDMFIAWAAHEAGVVDRVGQFASTIEHATWFKEQGAWGTRPEPGAIVFYSFSGSRSIDGISHVGIVESVKGRTLHTIEGNTDGIYLKRKTRDFSDVVGYGYPAKVKDGAYIARHSRPEPAAATVATVQRNVPKHDEPLISQDGLLGGLLAVAVCGTVALAAGRALAARVPAEAPIRVRRRGRHHRALLPMLAAAANADAAMPDVAEAVEVEEPSKRRKRGKHHRPARPLGLVGRRRGRHHRVTLPADITPADLDFAESVTAVMPAVTAAVAAEAEDREFWNRVSHFADDADLAFWDGVHAELGSAQPSRQ